MLNLERPAFALVIVVLAIFGIRQCERAKEYKTLSELSQESATLSDKLKRAHIQRAQASIDSVKILRTSDSLKFEARISQQNASTAFWKARASKSRPVVVELAKTDTTLAAYVQATDSVIKSQDSTIVVQKNHIMAQAKLYEFEIAAHGEKYVKAIELADTWQKEAYRQEKIAGKEGRRKRFWRGAAVVAGSVAIVLELAIQ